MSNGEIKKVSRQDIQLVQNLIERCLQLYMNQEEVIRTLLYQAKIEPGFTELVWQKLEEENQDFFRAYHLRLMLKDQIERFNDLLERQIESMQMYRSRPIPMLNGSQTRQERDSTCQATGHAGPNVTPENVQQPINTNLYPNSIKSEAEYSGNFSFLYGSDTNALEPHPGINNPSVSSFSTVESNSQPSNENVLNADTPSFGFLGQIPRNFSLSDLTADFSNSSEILESYSGSAFLARDINNFLDPQDIERLDTVSEGLSFEDFASD